MKRCFCQGDVMCSNCIETEREIDEYEERNAPPADSSSPSEDF